MKYRIEKIDENCYAIYINNSNARPTIVSWDCRVRIFKDSYPVFDFKNHGYCGKISVKMDLIQGTIETASAFSISTLSSKGLCDYAIDIRQGCRFGCTFCYVPSTSRIRCQTPQIKAAGVADPQQDWGDYAFDKRDLVDVLKRIRRIAPGLENQC
ncbi:MAG: hypothetical protein HC786_21355 [Richelia sp. CSU_2_1]|nr:hypothetical protein [Richelia sp. CSU_2_1]